MPDNEYEELVDKASEVIDRNIKKYFPDVTPKQIQQLAQIALAEFEVDGPSGGEVSKLLLEGF